MAGHALAADQSLRGLLPRRRPILPEEFDTPIHRLGPASHQVMPFAFIDMERHIFIRSLEPPHSSARPPHRAASVLIAVMDHDRRADL